MHALKWPINSARIVSQSRNALRDKHEMLVQPWADAAALKRAGGVALFLSNSPQQQIGPRGALAALPYVVLSARLVQDHVRLFGKLSDWSCALPLLKAAAAAAAGAFTYHRECAHQTCM